MHMARSNKKPTSIAKESVSSWIAWYSVCNLSNLWTSGVKCFNVNLHSIYQSLNSSFEGVTLTSYSYTQVRKLSLPGSDMSYHACYVVYSQVLLSVILRSAMYLTYHWCLCLHLIYTSKAVMQHAKYRWIMQSIFLNENKLFVVISCKASSEINLSCCLSWSWRHGDDWGIYSPLVNCGRWYNVFGEGFLEHTHMYQMTDLLNSYSS